jgi:hypothetical protein
MEETYESIQYRVQQKIRDRQVDAITFLVLAIIAEDALKVVELIIDNDLEMLDIETAQKLFHLSLEFGKPVDVKEFVRSYLYYGIYSEYFAELKRESELEDSYDNQF